MSEDAAAAAATVIAGVDLKAAAAVKLYRGFCWKVCQWY